MSLFKKAHLIPNTSISRAVNVLRSGLDRQMTDVDDQISVVSGDLATANEQIESAASAISALQSATIPWFDSSSDYSETPTTVTFTDADTWYDIYSHDFALDDFTGDSVLIVATLMWDVGTSSRHTLRLYANPGAYTETQLPHLGDNDHNSYVMVMICRPSSSSLTVKIQGKRTVGSYGGGYTHRGLYLVGGWS